MLVLWKGKQVTGYYLQSTTTPSIRFRIISRDKDTGVARLMGMTGVEFTEVVNKEMLAKYRYKIVKETADDTV